MICTDMTAGLGFTTISLGGKSEYLSMCTCTWNTCTVSQIAA